MPPSRNILSRRLSSYDPSIYNPPAILRPSASRFYSWPRPPCVILPPVINSPDSESAQPSPPQRAPKVAPKPAALKAAAIEDCFTDGSEGEEELDELANDDQEECDEVDQREEDPEPSSSNQRGTVRPTIARAIAVADQSANKSSLRRRPVVQQAAFGVFDAEEGSPDSTSSQPSSSRSGKPSTNQVGPSRASVAPEVAEDDARDASVGPSLARYVLARHTPHMHRLTLYCPLPDPATTNIRCRLPSTPRQRRSRSSTSSAPDPKAQTPSRRLLLAHLSTALPVTSTSTSAWVACRCGLSRRRSGPSHKKEILTLLSEGAASSVTANREAPSFRTGSFTPLSSPTSPASVRV